MASRIVWNDGDVVSASDLNTWFEDIEELQTDAAQSKNDAEAAANTAVEAAVHSPIIQNGTWWVWDFDNEEYVDTEVNATGDDGASPIITENKSGKVTTVTVTDGAGTHTFELHDGADGAGSGDMLKTTYDPSGKARDIFAYADAVQTNLNTHKDNSSIHVTSADKTNWNAKSDKAVSFTATLYSGGWESLSGSQVVFGDAFLADGYAYMVSPAPGYLADYSKAQIYADDVTEDGQMAFWCETVPTEDLEVNIVRMVVEDE